MSITFNTVPSNAVASRVFIEQEFRRSGVSGPLPQRIAILGQYNSGFSPTANTAVAIDSPDFAASIFGNGSQLHRLAQKVFSGIGGGLIAVDAFPLADGTGSSTGTITVTGPATSSGTISLYIGGDLVQIAVASGNIATAIATAIGAAINAKIELPVTASVASAVVTLTAKWVGLSANQITVLQDLQTSDVAAEPSGVGIAIVAMSGGSADPSIATALTNFGDTWYTWVVNPYNADTSMDLIEAAGELRAGAGVKRPFIGLVGYNGTRANYITWLGDRNSPWTTSIPVDSSPTHPGEIAASAAGVCAVSAQNEPARPYKGLILNGVFPGATANWTYDQANAVEILGGSWTSNINGVVVIRDLLTTYTTNTLGAADTSWRYTTRVSNYQAKIYTLDILSNSAPFDRAVIVDDNAVTGKEFAVSPKRIKSYVIDLVDNVWIANAWSKNRDAIVAGIIAEIDPTNSSRINVLVPDDMADGLRIIAIKYQWTV